MTVTAAVDRITLRRPLTSICDLELSGRVTFATGRSSMEVSLQVAKAPEQGKEVEEDDILMTCAFTMVTLFHNAFYFLPRSLRHSLWLSRPLANKVRYPSTQPPKSPSQSPPSTPRPLQNTRSSPPAKKPTSSRSPSAALPSPCKRPTTPSLTSSTHYGNPNMHPKSPPPHPRAPKSP